MAMRRRRQQRPEADGAAELLADGERLDEGGHDEEGEQQLAQLWRMGSKGSSKVLWEGRRAWDQLHRCSRLSSFEIFVKCRAKRLIYAKMPRESVWRPGGEVQEQVPVSYTHLTLPTKLEV